MATAVTTEEITRLVQTINKYREQVAVDRQQAKRVLRAAGIHTRKGTLKKPYR